MKIIKHLKGIMKNINKRTLQKVDNFRNPTPSTQIEQKYVYQVYDKISQHFSHTRYKPWPLVEAFLKSLPQGSLVYDLGCGNGKYLGVAKHLQIVGSDRCLGLLQKAKSKDILYELIRADCLNLPFRSQSCDGFISIAVIHHFSTQSLRNQAISELCRITRVGGIGLIYVWAYEQDLQGSISRKKFTQQDIFVPWHLHFKYEQNLDQLDWNGKNINIEKSSVIYHRFYHVFKRGQLDSLIRKNQNLQIIESYYDKQNWCCMVKRIK